MMREETESLRTKSLADLEKIITDEEEVRRLKNKMIRAKVNNEANSIGGSESKDHILKGNEGVRMVEYDRLCIKLFEMQDYIRSQDIAELIEEFGEGSHRVCFKLEFDVSSASGDAVVFPKVNDLFVIDMDPIYVLPPSFRFFVDKVRHKIWDGTSLSYKSSHIILTREATPDRNPAPLDYYKERDIHSIYFQSYRNIHPHLPYTVGFASLPGGSRWYTNKENNVNSNGPGGQY